MGVHWKSDFYGMEVQGKPIYGGKLPKKGA